MDGTKVMVIISGQADKEEFSGCNGPAVYISTLAMLSIVKCDGYFYVVTVDFLRSEC